MCGFLPRGMSDSLIQRSPLIQCRSWQCSLLIRLLVCLMLESIGQEFEKERWKCPGRKQTGSHSKTDGKLCQLCCLWPWLSGHPERAGPLSWSWPHTLGPEDRDSGSLGDGRVAVAASHQWGRWGVGDRRCPTRCALHLPHSSLSGPPSPETNGREILGMQFSLAKLRHYTAKWWAQGFKFPARVPHKGPESFCACPKTANWIPC